MLEGFLCDKDMILFNFCHSCHFSILQMRKLRQSDMLQVTHWWSHALNPVWLQNLTMQGSSPQRLKQRKTYTQISWFLYFSKLSLIYMPEKRVNCKPYQHLHGFSTKWATVTLVETWTLHVILKMHATGSMGFTTHRERLSVMGEMIHWNENIFFFSFQKLTLCPGMVKIVIRY